MTNSGTNEDLLNGIATQMLKIDQTLEQLNKQMAANNYLALAGLAKTPEEREAFISMAKTCMGIEAQRDASNELSGKFL